MNCNDIQDDLSAYMDEELPPTRAAEIAAHLRDCPECQKLHDELLAVVGELHAIAPESAPEPLARNVMDEIRSPDSAAASPGTTRSALAAAAVVVVVFSLVVLTNKERARPVTATRTPLRKANEVADATCGAKQAPTASAQETESPAAVEPKEPEAQATLVATRPQGYRRITVQTNDVDRARQDVIRLTEGHVQAVATGASEPKSELVWQVTPVEYKALLERLEAAGYQLEPEEIEGDEGASVSAAQGKAASVLQVTIRFRAIRE